MNISYYPVICPWLREQWIDSAVSQNISNHPRISQSIPIIIAFTIITLSRHGISHLIEQHPDSNHSQSLWISLTTWNGPFSAVQYRKQPNKSTARGATDILPDNKRYSHFSLNLEYRGIHKHSCPYDFHKIKYQKYYHSKLC